MPYRQTVFLEANNAKQYFRCLYYCDSVPDTKCHSIHITSNSSGMKTCIKRTQFMTILIVLDSAQIRYPSQIW